MHDIECNKNDDQNILRIYIIWFKYLIETI